MASTERDTVRDVRRDEGDGHEHRTRVRRQPRTGTKVTTLVAVCAVVVGVYYLVAPVFMETANGWFGCGAVLWGEKDEFVANVCKGATDAHLVKAVLAGALALVVGVLGALLFGFDTTVERRRVPHRRDDDLRDDDLRDDDLREDDLHDRDDRDGEQTRVTEDRETRGRGARTATRRRDRYADRWDDEDEDGDDRARPRGRRSRSARDDLDSGWDF